ncbi:Glucose-signaling factor 2 [Nakaseomyces bracarensis]|uniref:Glucose-signaling factor 2 n=1 Tax=Nakaseomyces bracarensis TaxID=273131 RepID=A0ABR4NLQ1_9SACH
MEIYVRLNDDIEHDYAFQVNKEDTINSKIKKIFQSDLSKIMVLRPSIFHEYRPSSYKKSDHPGFLTNGGCLIFDYDANEKEYLKDLDEEKPLFEQLWPGQLIVPQWKLAKKTVVLFALLMIGWLYTDLPDCISPTPGICLTNQLSRLILPLVRQFEMHELAAKLESEIQPNFSSIEAQWVFFAFHIFKIICITTFFYLGIANPITFNPIRLWYLRNELDIHNPKFKNMLKVIGWIGARKATYDAYQTNFFNYMIDKYGGQVKAYRAGIIKQVASPGVKLHEGEGFQTPLKDRFTASTFKEMEENERFILSEEYFVELENNLKENLDKCNGDIGNMNMEIRRFRRFGIYEPNEKMSDLFKARRARADREKAESAKEESKKTK